MRRFTVTNLVVVLLILCANGCNSNTKPTAESVKPALQNYLATQHVGVQGASVKKLEGIRVGNYEANFKGWEVFSDFAVQYKDNGIPITLRGSSNGAPTCYVRNVGGKSKCFKPAIFVELEKKMNQELSGFMDL